MKKGSNARLLARWVKKTHNLLAAISLVGVSAYAPRAEAAAISLTTSTYTENFDGSGSTIPNGWVYGTGSYASGSSTPTRGTVTSLNGTSGGGTYIFNAGGDKAIGILNSGSFGNSGIEFGLTNNTGSVISAFDFSWNFEKYRSGSRSWSWALTTSMDGSSWGSAIGAGGETYTPDANNTVVTFSPPGSVAKTVNLSGLTINPGDSYYFRWSLTGAGGISNGQALAIDDFNLTATLQSVGTTATTYALASAVTGPATVIVGGSTAVSSTITNTGTPPNDTLSYTDLSASATGGSISGSPSSSGTPIAPGANNNNGGLTFTGSTPGTAVVTPTVSAATNATLGGVATESTAPTSTNITVLDHANGAFDAQGTTKTISFDFGSIAQGSPATDFAFDVHNVVTSEGFTSELDLAAIDIQGTGDTSVLTTNVGAIADLLAGNFQSFLASFSTASPGEFEATYTFHVGDNTAYNGAVVSSTPLVLQLSGVVTGSVVTSGDFDGDGDVDGADFIAWQTNFPLAGGATPTQGDANGDGHVDGADFAVWQSQFGSGPGPGTSPVPEPSSMILGCFGILGLTTFALRRRNRA